MSKKRNNVNIHDKQKQKIAYTLLYYNVFT